MLKCKLEPTESLPQGDLLVNIQVQFLALEGGVVHLLQDDYHIACISVRLFGGEGGSHDGHMSHKQEGAHYLVRFPRERDLLPMTHSRGNWNLQHNNKDHIHSIVLILGPAPIQISESFGVVK